METNWQSLLLYIGKTHQIVNVLFHYDWALVGGSDRESNTLCRKVQSTIGEVKMFVKEGGLVTG